MPRPWSQKFASAWRGVWLAIGNERSFAVHVPMAVAVALAAAALRTSLLENCVLTLCVTLVLAAEVFNTAIEFLSRDISRDVQAGIANALDMASGAVLLCSLGAAGVGAAIFGHRLAIQFGWWS